MSPSKAHLCIPTAWLLTRFQLVMLEEMIEPFIAKGPSIKYVTLFLTNFYPPPSPVTLRHTSLDPRKYVTQTVTPPIFKRPSTKNPDKSLLVQILSQLFEGVFVRGIERVFEYYEY